MRAADGASNNLIEADNASSDADFLHKMSIALREARESQAALIKIRMGSLDQVQTIADKGLESEAGQLAAIFASIILNMRLRLEEARKTKKKDRKDRKDRKG